MIFGIFRHSTTLDGATFSYLALLKTLAGLLVSILPQNCNHYFITKARQINQENKCFGH